MTHALAISPYRHQPPRFSPQGETGSYRVRRLREACVCPPREAHEHLLAKGIAVVKSPYTRFDGLERSEDLELLLAVLCKHRGSDGKPALLTANTVMGNPDFEAIESSDFKEYTWMDLEKSYENAGDSERVLSLMQEGIQEGLWLPQFHGREHVNVARG